MVGLLISNPKQINYATIYVIIWRRGDLNMVHKMPMWTDSNTTFKIWKQFTNELSHDKLTPRNFHVVHCCIDYTYDFMFWWLSFVMVCVEQLQKTNLATSQLRTTLPFPRYLRFYELFGFDETSKFRIEWWTRFFEWWNMWTVDDTIITFEQLKIKNYFLINKFCWDDGICTKLNWTCTRFFITPREYIHICNFWLMTPKIVQNQFADNNYKPIWTENDRVWRWTWQHFDVRANTSFVFTRHVLLWVWILICNLLLYLNLN